MPDPITPAEAIQLLPYIATLIRWARDQGSWPAGPRTTQPHVTTTPEARPPRPGDPDLLHAAARAVQQLARAHRELAWTGRNVWKPQGVLSVPPQRVRAVDDAELMSAVYWLTAQLLTVLEADPDHRTLTDACNHILGAWTAFPAECRYPPDGYPPPNVCRSCGYRKVKARGMCNTCYQANWRATARTLGTTA